MVLSIRGWENTSHIGMEGVGKNLWNMWEYAMEKNKIWNSKVSAESVIVLYIQNNRMAWTLYAERRKEDL